MFCIKPSVKDRATCVGLQLKTQQGSDENTLTLSTTRSGTQQSFGEDAICKKYKNIVKNVTPLILNTP